MGQPRTGQPADKAGRDEEVKDGMIWDGKAEGMVAEVGTTKDRVAGWWCSQGWDG